MPECEKGDFFRDTWVRYLGYSNEVGESFRILVPTSVVRFSYKLTFGYVLADTVDKSFKAYWKEGRARKALTEAGDALIWQGLASVVIPGFTINRICHYTNTGLVKYGRSIPPMIRRYMVVGVGLASIPIIVHPIDAGVTLLMNNTYRRFF